MSSPPGKYVRHTDFTDFSTGHPDEQQPGVDLDIEYDRLKLTTDAIIDRLAEIQRADGRLANTSVHKDALDSTVRAMLATGIGLPRGAWATVTAYALRDLVSVGSVTYIAVSPHTSGVFATDLAAGKWMSLAATTDQLTQPRQLWLDFSPLTSAKAANSASLNAMLAQCAINGITVCLPGNAGSIPMDAQINIPHGGGLDCEIPGGAILDFSNATGLFPDNAYVVAKGSFTALPALNADITSDGRISTVLATTPTPLVQGDVLFLVDKGTLWNNVRAYYYQGEAIRVFSQVGTTVNFETPLLSTYKAASTKVNRLNGVRVSLRNFAIIGGATHQAQEMQAWTIIGGHGCVVENVVASNANYTGGQLTYCVDCVVNNGDQTKLLPDNGQGDSYGLTISNCHNVRVNGGRFVSSRHGVAMGGGDSDYAIVTRYAVVSNAFLGHNAQSDVLIYAADIHGGCQFCGYINCFIDGGVDLGGDRNFVLGGTIRAGSFFGLPASAIELSEAKSLNHIIAPSFIDVRGIQTVEAYGIVLNASASGGAIDAHTTDGGTLILAPRLVTYRPDGIASGKYQAVISFQNNGATADMRLVIGGDWRCSNILLANYVVSTIVVLSGSNFAFVDLSEFSGDMAWDIRNTNSVKLDGAHLNQVGLNKSGFTPTFGVGAAVRTLNCGTVSATGLHLKGDAGNGLGITNATTADVTGLRVQGFSTGLALDTVARLKLAPGDLDGDGVLLQSCPTVYYTPGVKDGPITESGSGSGVTIYKSVYKSPPLGLDLNATDNTGLAAPATSKVTGWHVATAKSNGWDAANQKYVFTDGRARRVRVIWKARATGAGMTYTVQPYIYKNGALAFAGVFINGLSACTESGGEVCADVDMNGTSDYLEFYISMPSGATALKGANASTFVHIEEIY